VGRQGKGPTLDGEFWGVEGLAWTADGQSILFSGLPLGGAQQMWPQIVDAAGAGPPREAFRTASWQFVQDVAPDGRMLTTGEDVRWSIRALLPGQTVEREFGWLDWSVEGMLSPDGTHLLLSHPGLPPAPPHR